MTEPCRCGHVGDGPHPCHGKSYTCGKPALRRFYDPRLPCLAGAQTKVTVNETWACDPCWEAWAGRAGKGTR